MEFQSTLPVGGATKPYLTADAWLRISIHAPRGGSDLYQVRDILASLDFNPRSPWGERRHLGPGAVVDLDFNPRSPWGERLQSGDRNITADGFQSTLPVGGATGRTPKSLKRPRFQSTLPVGGATQLIREPFCRECYFNPRSPWGERR